MEGSESNLIERAFQLFGKNELAQRRFRNILNKNKITIKLVTNCFIDVFCNKQQAYFRLNHFCIQTDAWLKQDYESQYP